MQQKLHFSTQTLRTVFRVNIVFGLLVLAVATFFTITGSSDNLAARKATEGLLNVFALGGLLYAFLAWSVYTFSWPYLAPHEKK